MNQETNEPLDEAKLLPSNEFQASEKELLAEEPSPHEGTDETDLGSVTWPYAPNDVFAQYPYMLPWSMRGFQPDHCWWTPHDPYSQYFQNIEEGRGYFTGSFPHLLPFYPIYNVSPGWMDPWSMQGYQGYWWT